MFPSRTYDFPAALGELDVAPEPVVPVADVPLLLEAEEPAALPICAFVRMYSPALLRWLELLADPLVPVVPPVVPLPSACRQPTTVMEPLWGLVEVD